MINIIDATRVNAPIIRSVIEFFAPVSVSIPFLIHCIIYCFLSQMTMSQNVPGKIFDS